MGCCNSINEQTNIRASNKRRISKYSDQTTVSESDYIIKEQYINHNDINKKYTLSKSLGEGATGIVCEGIDKNGKHYAIKRVNKMKLKHKSLLYNEAKISLSLNHPHIIKTYEIYEDLKSVSFVMELINGGDLFEFITKSPNGKLDDSTALNLLIQLLETLYYLHEEKHIVHRDIKPENLLVEISEDGIPNLKLIDFGFACEITENLNDIIGTPMYTAPEIILREKYNEKVDIWSTGILFFNLLTGCEPFNSEYYIPLDEQIINKSIPFEHISNEKFRDLMKKLLDKNPQKRLSAKEALNIAYDLRDEMEKNELYEQFKLLDKDNLGKLPLQSLFKYFKLDIGDKNDKIVDFNEFYKIVFDSVKEY